MKVISNLLHCNGLSHKPDHPKLLLVGILWKVITWNCNLKFKEKFELIDSYDP